jgi:hypothetical protein
MALGAPSSSEDTVPRATSRFGSLIGYGLPILACAAAVVAAFLIEQEREHTGWALGIASVAAITTLLSAISQHFRERETSRLGGRLTKLIEENSRLSKAIRSDVTGGDSFAMAYFPEKDGKHWLALRHFGNETLRDIRIKVDRFFPDQMMDAFVYPSLLPNAVEMLKPYEFRADEVTLQVSFHAPNGWWAETVKGVRKGGELIFALQAWRLDSSGTTLTRATLHEDVHPSFPRQPDGRVDWSVGTLDVSKLTPSIESAEDLRLRGLGMR